MITLKMKKQFTEGYLSTIEVDSFITYPSEDHPSVINMMMAYEKNRILTDITGNKYRITKIEIVKD